MLKVGQGGGVEVGYGVYVGTNKVELILVDIGVVVCSDCDLRSAHPTLTAISKINTHLGAIFVFIKKFG